MSVCLFSFPSYLLLALRLFSHFGECQVLCLNFNAAFSSAVIYRLKSCLLLDTPQIIIIIIIPSGVPLVASNPFQLRRVLAHVLNISNSELPNIIVQRDGAVLMKTPPTFEMS